MNRFDVALGKNPKEDLLMNCLKEVEAIYSGDGKDQQIWLGLSEDDAMATAHHGLGQYLRNEWELWSNQGIIVEYFHRLGITHPDDMSGIILTSYHRWKNNKPIDLKEQIKQYKKYWKEAARAKIRGDDEVRAQIQGITGCMG